MSTSTLPTKLDIEAIRKRFPILHQEVNGYPLVYFDNAATTQKPDTVIKALNDYYSGYNANIHRGVHTLADKATEAFEETRKKARSFINAPETEEIIFTQGTTQSINLVAQTYGRQNVAPGDRVIISAMEHHSNIGPWQILCEEKGAELSIIPITESGEIEMDRFLELLDERTRIVSIVFASNSLGTINPLKEVIEAAHKAGAVTVVDGAQSAAHLNIDVQELDCDFFAFSAHKMYGPTGVGILYGKRSLLEAMPPYQGGGEMIKEVTFEKTTYNDIPYKFEAGTPNVADVVAFANAIEFIEELGKNNIAAHENELMEHTGNVISSIERVRPVGTAAHKVSVYSFNIDGIHPFDVGMMLDSRGIAVRTGHHCTQPVMDGYGIEGTVRASFGVYNTKEEIDRLAEGIDRVIGIMK